MYLLRIIGVAHVAGARACPGTAPDCTRALDTRYRLARELTCGSGRTASAGSHSRYTTRRASRHQLHKHVNARVYLGVWRITLNSVQAVVGDPHDHVDKPFAWHNFRIPRFGKSKLDLANRDIMLFRLWKHIFTFTLISCTVKSGLWVVVVLVC